MTNKMMKHVKPQGKLNVRENVWKWDLSMFQVNLIVVPIPKTLILGKLAVVKTNMPRNNNTT